MASRVFQLGTIVSRVNRLIETGVLKERPVWLDVVEAFPPDVFPKHNSTPEGGRAPAIVYPEDQLRRNFYTNYEVINQPEECQSLFEEKPTSSVCSRFVLEQLQRMSLGDDEKEAGRRALWILRSEGIDIRLKEMESLPVASSDSESGKASELSTLKTLQGLLKQMHSRKSHTSE